MRISAREAICIYARVEYGLEESVIPAFVNNIEQGDGLKKFCEDHDVFEKIKDEISKMPVGRQLYADDCLNVLNNMMDESVDLIYLDPPFNSKANYNLPFKGKDKNKRPVEAFTDIWNWSHADAESLERMKSTHPNLALVIEFAIRNGDRKRGLASYLVNMAERLIPMKRVLKSTGSIYLHCDPTASHYLKLIMDDVFGSKCFVNEIIWCYGGRGMAKKNFQRKHDIILFYGATKKYMFNTEGASRPVAPEHVGRYNKTDENGRMYARVKNKDGSYSNIYLTNVVREDWWEIPYVRGNERLGYPTQKPLALLERIIKASTNPGDIVLDPFCGCGTTVHAAEKLGRNWIGIDISTFSVGLIRNRLKKAFSLDQYDIVVHEIPTNAVEARALASKDKFEFEKWACGHIGASGMYKSLGAKGADGGIDGVLEFHRIPVFGKKANKEHAIVQVKGGNVTPDAVRALKQVVDDEPTATAGIIVCFEDQMKTVENNRSQEIFKDGLDRVYPVIQGFSIEDMLTDKEPNLPNVMRNK